MQELRIDLKDKVFVVKKEKDGVRFTINSQSVLIPLSSLPQVLSFLDCMFYGILKENQSVQGIDGYLVFLRGQDKWGIRVGREDSREVVYLTRMDLRTLFYFLLL